jgi:hypothetical protein
MDGVDELRAEIQHCRNLERAMTDPQVRVVLRELIAELEARIREAENSVD